MRLDLRLLLNDILETVQEIAIHFRHIEDLFDIRSLSQQGGNDINALIITLSKLLPQGFLTHFIDFLLFQMIRLHF